ncbi:MAG: tetratricopeptide repeat protein [Chitinophagales bacterium]
MLKYILKILVFLFVMSHQLMGFDKIDSLKAILISKDLTKNKDTIADIYNEIGELYSQESDYKSALKYFQQGLETVLYATSNNPSIISFFYLNLGNTYAQLNDFPASIQHYNSAITIGEQDEEAQETVANSWRGMGSLYVKVGDYTQAYTCHLEAMKLSTTEESLGHSYYTIGSIFFHQKQWNEALDYYQKSLEIWSKTTFKSWHYSCNDAIGVVYGKMGKFDKWFEYSQLAMSIATEGGYIKGIAYGKHNMAGYYQDIGCLDEALLLYQEALQKMKVIEDKSGEAKVLRYMAKTYLEQEKYNMALFYLEDALSIAEPIGIKPTIAEVYKLLYQAYYKTSKLSMAYEYQSKYLILNDSLIAVNNMERILSMKIRDELQKKELMIARLQKKQEIKQLYPKASFTGIIVLALLGLLLFNRYYLVQIEHKLLDEKKVQSEKEREVLADSNRSLEYFATVASNDLQKPLYYIDELVSDIEDDYKGNLTEESHLYVHYISDGIQRMSNLLTDLLSYAKLDSRKTAWKLSNVNVPKLVGEVKRSLVNVIEEKNAEIIIEHLPDYIVANQTTLTQLLQNLISNGLKFVGEKTPVIRINCVIKKDKYIFSVQDNGIGIAPENQKRIFEIFQRLHTNSEYKGTGIGLATCQKIVKRHGGKIKLTSELGYGTTFFFSINRNLSPDSNNQQSTLQKVA